MGTALQPRSPLSVQTQIHPQQSLRGIIPPPQGTAEPCPSPAQCQGCREGLCKDRPSSTGTSCAPAPLPVPPVTVVKISPQNCSLQHQEKSKEWAVPHSAAGRFPCACICCPSPSSAHPPPPPEPGRKNSTPEGKKAQHTWRFNTGSRRVPQQGLASLGNKPGIFTAHFYLNGLIKNIVCMQIPTRNQLRRS